MMQATYFLDDHQRMVRQLHVMMDEAAVEYDTDEDVVDDFVHYVRDWANLRLEASLDRKGSI